MPGKKKSSQTGTRRKKRSPSEITAKKQISKMPANTRFERIQLRLLRKFAMEIGFNPAALNGKTKLDFRRFAVSVEGKKILAQAEDTFAGQIDQLERSQVLLRQKILRMQKNDPKQFKKKEQELRRKMKELETEYNKALLRLKITGNDFKGAVNHLRILRNLKNP